MASCQKPERTIFEKLPFEIVDADDSEGQKTRTGSSDYVFVGPKRYIELIPYKTYGLEIYNFEARPDDVYLVGYQRSGTTLHSEMVWQIGNGLNYAEAEKDFLVYRFPHLDSCLFPRTKLIKEISERKDVSGEVLEIAQKYQEVTLEGLGKRKGPRFIKAHLPLSLMPPHIFEVGAKVIYCARNPKDVLISMIHLSDFLKFDRTSHIRDWFEDFKADLAWNCPYFEHVLEAWNRRHDKNFLFLFYEDTIKDKRQTIRKVADFLGKKLTKDQIDSLEEYLEFEKFKKNKSVNHQQMITLGFAQDNGKFIRQGKSGGWREVFDESLKKEFDQLIEERLKGTDLRFPDA